MYFKTENRFDLCFGYKVSTNHNFKQIKTIETRTWKYIGLYRFFELLPKLDRTQIGPEPNFL